MEHSTRQTDRPYEHGRKERTKEARFFIISYDCEKHRPATSIPYPFFPFPASPTHLHHQKGREQGRGEGVWCCRFPRVFSFVIAIASRGTWVGLLSSSARHRRRRRRRKELRCFLPLCATVPYPSLMKKNKPGRSWLGRQMERSGRMGMRQMCIGR